MNNIFLRVPPPRKPSLTRVLPAFTLAEILAVIVILGVVAVMVIPSTVNKSIESSDRVKMLKAMSTYERWVPQFMLDNGLTTQQDAANLFFAEIDRTESCDFILKYFKVKRDISNIDGYACAFESNDGLNWVFDAVSFDGQTEALRTDVYFTPKNRNNSIASIDNPDLRDKPIKINGQKIEAYGSRYKGAKDPNKYIWVTSLIFYFAYNPENGGLYVNDKNITPWEHYAGEEYCRHTADIKKCQGWPKWLDEHAMLPYEYTGLIKNN